MKLDRNWRETLRKSWTVRVNAVGLAVMAFIASLPFEPASLLGVWNMMPAEVRRIAPTGAVAVIGAALFALSIFSRLRFKGDDKP